MIASKFRRFEALRPIKSPLDFESRLSIVIIPVSPTMFLGRIGYTKFLATSYGNKGIRANCISPGGVQESQSKQFIKNYCKRVPLQRMATTDDVAAAALFLASDASAYITGTNLVVDGGYTAW
mgnify:CR=1 FL=1